MWNERCRIIKAEKEGTLEKRQREAAYEFCKLFKFKLAMFHPKHHHLLRKIEHFFQTSTLDTIFMWQQEVYSAMTYEPPQQKNKITSFFTSTNPTPPQATPGPKTNDKAKRKTTKTKRPTSKLPKSKTIIYYPKHNHTPMDITTRKRNHTSISQHTDSSEPHYVSDSSTHVKKAKQISLAKAFQSPQLSQPIPSSITIPIDSVNKTSQLTKNLQQ